MGYKDEKNQQKMLAASNGGTTKTNIYIWPTSQNKIQLFLRGYAILAN
jgi:hypothetical protein